MASAARGLSVDPVDAILAEETTRDHAMASVRGARIKRLADALVTSLVGRSLLLDSQSDDARVALFSILADDIYGTAAIDIPPLRGQGRRP